MTLMGDGPELRLGASGEHVVQLQDRLRGLGLLYTQPDGTYDENTEYAVRQLRSTLGYDDDATMTTETWQALDQYMLAQGLTYNHYAGPGNQHWDVEAQQAAYAGWDADASAEAAYSAESLGAAEPAAEAVGAAEAVQIPHLDAVHPAIRDSDQFPTFQEFLRNHGG